MIKYLCMDVDGTLTDGKIYMSSNGEMVKAFNIKDGYGIRNILNKYELIPIIITGRKSDIVTERCKELNVTEIYQNIFDKLQLLYKIIKDLSMIAYIGDDLNDLKCMQCIKESGGIIGCPADAVDEVRDIADFVSPYKGGEGAVRSFIEWIVKNKENI